MARGDATTDVTSTEAMNSSDAHTGRWYTLETSIFAPTNTRTAAWLIESYLNPPS